MNPSAKGSESKEKKNFLARWLDKLDKKLEEQSKKSGCCSPDKGKKGSSCC